jgi:hypothetical protein
VRLLSLSRRYTAYMHAPDFASWQDAARVLAARMAVPSWVGAIPSLLSRIALLHLPTKNTHRPRRNQCSSCHALRQCTVLYDWKLILGCFMFFWKETRKVRMDPPKPGTLKSALTSATKYLGPISETRSTCSIREQPGTGHKNMFDGS